MAVDSARDRHDPLRGTRSTTTTEVETANRRLRVVVEGSNVVLTLKSVLEVPLTGRGTPPILVRRRMAAAPGGTALEVSNVSSASPVSGREVAVTWTDEARPWVADEVGT